jgi:hypothetical protein
VIVIRRLSIRVARSRRGDALFLGRACGEALGADLAGADALASGAEVRLDGGARPAPLLAREVAATAAGALGRSGR